MLKNILKELSGIDDIADEELIRITSEEILLERKPYDLKNFILKIKELNYKALPHFAFAKKHLSKIAKARFIRKNQTINNLIKLVTQLELADYLLNQGASLKEIKKQTDIPNELLVSIIKKNYKNIPKEILRFRLINYRILKLAKLQEEAFKSLLPLLSKSDKLLAITLLKDFEDLIKSETKERAKLEYDLNQ